MKKIAMVMVRMPYAKKVPAMLNSDVLPASRVYPGSSRQAYLANRALHELR
ncbi:hypothetical protein LAD67_07675 [Escherichia coli]|nr:hypothetical protein [Escherichia coli]